MITLDRASPYSRWTDIATRKGLLQIRSRPHPGELGQYRTAYHLPMDGGEWLHVAIEHPTAEAMLAFHQQVVDEILLAEMPEVDPLAMRYPLCSLATMIAVNDAAREAWPLLHFNYPCDPRGVWTIKPENLGRFNLVRDAYHWTLTANNLPA